MEDVVCNPELQGSWADSAALTNIASRMTGRTISACASDTLETPTRNTLQHVNTYHFINTI